MQRRTLTVLADNPDLISGVYNYCDRWCERCPLTSRCLVYATEQEENDPPENQDIRNEAFWQKLEAILAQTRELIASWAAESGIDLSELPVTDDARSRRKRQQVDNHPLTKFGKAYANAAGEWFRELDRGEQVNAGHRESPEDAREVIQWYQYQIAVKTMRALSGRAEETDDNPELPRDSDGSIKVALIGIERSIAAWRMMQLSLPQCADSIVTLILQLETLRTRLELEFPHARDFVRPGFDEVLSPAS